MYPGYVRVHTTHILEMVLGRSFFSRYMLIVLVSAGFPPPETPDCVLQLRIDAVSVKHQGYLCASYQIIIPHALRINTAAAQMRRVYLGIKLSIREKTVQQQ